MTLLIRSLSEMGAVYGSRAAYESAFEVAFQAQTKRGGEIVGARFLVERGIQLIDDGKPYEAIRVIGRSLAHLFKDESRSEAIRALYCISVAFERAGLLWASRGAILNAASLTSYDFYQSGTISELAEACFSRGRALELRLGRVPLVLSWHELFLSARRTPAPPEGRPESIKDDVNFDAILGLLLLRAPLAELPVVGGLPDVLDRLGLYLSSAALLYALGHDDKLPIELTGSSDPASIQAFFLKWRDQPAALEIAQTPHLGNADTVSLRSRVIGCEVLLESDNASPQVELAESLLAATEGFLATALSGASSREPQLKIRILKQASVFPFEFELKEDDGRPILEIRCGDFAPDGLNQLQQSELRAKVMDVLVTVLGRIAVFPDMEGSLAKLFRDERAGDRALAFTSSFVTKGNVLGSSAKDRVSDWITENDKVYELRRTARWDEGVEPEVSPQTIADARAPEHPAKGDPPNTVKRDYEAFSHSDVRTRSLIREALWNEASWAGTGFAGDGDHPPLFILLFRKHPAAERIFVRWLEEVGSDDSQERLRVSIIRKIDAQNPLAYTVIVGSNWPQPRDSAGLEIMVSRLSTMYPTTNKNLDRFLEGLRDSACYDLTFGSINESDGNINLGAQRIRKRELSVREAWQIGPNDPDCVGIDAALSPIIPEDQLEAPILALIEKRRNLARPKGG